MALVNSENMDVVETAGESDLGYCWYFTKEQLARTPSIKAGMSFEGELSHRHEAAGFMQDMGMRLRLKQSCINTAVVYMHRFYVFQSFTYYPFYQIGAAAVYLAAKVENQARDADDIILVANVALSTNDDTVDSNAESCVADKKELEYIENILIQTLGSDVEVDHPHRHIIKTCHLVRAHRDFAMLANFLASNSLHLTTLCIQHKPTVVACFCIMLACAWGDFKIPLSNERREWFTYVDETITKEFLQELLDEYICVFDRCPRMLKDKVRNLTKVSYNIQ